MKLLIHACCADCLIKMIESLKLEKKFDEIEIYYYNPNIHPRSEYQSRLKAMQLMFKDFKLIIPDWRPNDYFKVIKEKNKRCFDCWNLRLEKTAKFAKENGFNQFTSTLLTSEYQNSEKIQSIGGKIAKKYEIKFLVPKNVCKKLKTKRSEEHT